MYHGIYHDKNGLPTGGAALSSYIYHSVASVWVGSQSMQMEYSIEYSTRPRTETYELVSGGMLLVESRLVSGY